MTFSIAMHRNPSWWWSSSRWVDAGWNFLDAKRRRKRQRWNSSWNSGGSCWWCTFTLVVIIHKSAATWNPQSQCSAEPVFWFLLRKLMVPLSHYIWSVASDEQRREEERSFHFSLIIRHVAVTLLLLLLSVPLLLLALGHIHPPRPKDATTMITVYLTGWSSINPWSSFTCGARNKIKIDRANECDRDRILVLVVGHLPPSLLEEKEVFCPDDYGDSFTVLGWWPQFAFTSNLLFSLLVLSLQRISSKCHPHHLLSHCWSLKPMAPTWNLCCC